MGREADCFLPRPSSVAWPTSRSTPAWRDGPFRSHAPTRAQRWASRAPLNDDLREHLTATRARHRQRLILERGLAEPNVPSHAALASLERAATRDALRECQLLSFNRP